MSTASAIDRDSIVVEMEQHRFNQEEFVPLIARYWSEGGRSRGGKFSDWFTQCTGLALIWPERGVYIVRGTAAEIIQFKLTHL